MIRTYNLLLYCDVDSNNVYISIWIDIAWMRQMLLEWEKVIISVNRETRTANEHHKCLVKWFQYI